MDNAFQTTITLNGAITPVTTGMTLVDLFREHGIETRYVAVAVNKRFVPKSRHPEVVLNAGDRVDIVHPQPGG